MVKIKSVDPSCALASLGIKGGDTLISINGNEIRDVLDYRFYMTDTVLDITFSREGVQFSHVIKKREYDDIGLDFETPLMDKKHSCRNACIFCFVDQMPCGLRDTLYFKDDDSRLSFLHGNYITLTNMTEEDIRRIIKMRISPINVSVHTTNPDLRVKMMKNKRAGEVLSYLPMLAEAGISLCTQLVLCPGINDGEELERSMHDLVKLCPSLVSCAAVPVGLTKYRDGLYPLREYTPDEARAVIETVNRFGDYCLSTYGSRIFSVADEFYLKAGLPLPSEEYYEDYPQLENGVGLIRSLVEDLKYAIEDLPDGTVAPTARVLAVTGVAATDTLKQVADALESRFPTLKIDVLTVKNEFFGESVTVAGLLTGKDIANAVLALDSKDSYDRLIIPDAALKADEDVFLCGTSLEELSATVGLPTYAAPNEPRGLISAFCGIPL